MVTNVEPETGALAEVGVVFYLDELKEVSEKTQVMSAAPPHPTPHAPGDSDACGPAIAGLLTRGRPPLARQDRVKYIGQHRVIDRVKLKRVLNPGEVYSRETYLRAEVEVLRDVDAEGSKGADVAAAASLAVEEAEAEAIFVALVDAQKSLDEEPRFTDAVKEELSFDRESHWLATGGGQDACLWDCTGGGPEGREPIMLPHEAKVCAVAFQNSHGLLATASADGVVQLWSPERPKPLRATVKMPTPATKLAWSPDDQLLAVGSEKGVVYVLKCQA
jgi:hypothetical protein